MKAGDLVKFSDASSWSGYSHGTLRSPYAHFEGKVGLVMEEAPPLHGGAGTIERVHVLLDGNVRLFATAYFTKMEK